MSKLRLFRAPSTSIPQVLCDLIRAGKVPATFPHLASLCYDLTGDGGFVSSDKIVEFLGEEAGKLFNSEPEHPGYIEITCMAMSIEDALLEHTITLQLEENEVPKLIPSIDLSDSQFVLVVEE